ncbi:MAG: diguanylate cyclase [Rhodospirillaceae bacterium]|jgi:diguanylate cyclase (GGDEF)-like protein/PAS domain S-box-containing protein|nr:diguanylate cyclase [Rhodospirillaceae bacterium]MBT4219798.1 diguanylate cyclase [Rhodospirillaceae bacterium]MBT5013234.1 diguanylate cyclase [Rhodospirillaceae bacterium]MBT5308014.1 diguanylate cyclase [Rhodospirillaceae bacterium]MBT7356239.1 diguanylate cyclase [Rhodospirillaceae bacterium]
MTTKNEMQLNGLDQDWSSRLELLEQVHNLIAVCRDDRILYLNSAGAKILGLQKNDRAYNAKLASFFHPDFKDIAALGLDVFAEDETVISVKLLRPDGIEVDAEIWVTRLNFSGETTYLVEAHDITSHMRAARALRSREQRLEGILNTVADGIMSLDDHGNIQSFNPAAEKIFGFTYDEVIGSNVRILMPVPVEGDNFGTDWAKTLAPDREVVGQRKDGNTFPMEMAVREMRQGENLSFTSIVRDITARKEAEERVYNLAHFDPLTGLPNRHLLGDRLEESIKRASRSKSEVALMFIDLDKFKVINDNHGHAAGDEALKIVSQRLVTSARRTDTIARVGGDEFVAILEDLHSIDEAELIAQKMIAAISDPMEIKGNECSLGASIGICVYPDHADDIPGLMHCADQAMYVVKQESGDSNFRLYSADDEKAPAAD